MLGQNVSIKAKLLEFIHKTRLGEIKKLWLLESYTF